eukprot:g2989.t1
MFNGQQFLRPTKLRRRVSELLNQGGIPQAIEWRPRGWGPLPETAASGSAGIVQQLPDGCRLWRNAAGEEFIMAPEFSPLADPNQEQLQFFQSAEDENTPPLVRRLCENSPTVARDRSHSVEDDDVAMPDAGEEEALQLFLGESSQDRLMASALDESTRMTQSAPGGLGREGPGVGDSSLSLGAVSVAKTPAMVWDGQTPTSAAEYDWGVGRARSPHTEMLRHMLHCDADTQVGESLLRLQQGGDPLMQSSSALTSSFASRGSPTTSPPSALRLKRGMSSPGGSSPAQLDLDLDIDVDVQESQVESPAREPTVPRGGGRRSIRLPTTSDADGMTGTSSSIDAASASIRPARKHSAGATSSDRFGMGYDHVEGEAGGAMVRKSSTERLFVPRENSRRSVSIAEGANEDAEEGTTTTAEKRVERQSSRRKTREQSTAETAGGSAAVGCGAGEIQEENAIEMLRSLCSPHLQVQGPKSGAWLRIVLGREPSWSTHPNGKCPSASTKARGLSCCNRKRDLCLVNRRSLSLEEKEECIATLYSGELNAMLLAGQVAI